MRGRLTIAALGLAGVLYVWFAAVRLAAEIKERKVARRASRAG